MTQMINDYITVKAFCDMMGYSRSTFYEYTERDLPGFPQRVYPGGPGTHPKLLLRECLAYKDRVDKRRRPVGRPRKVRAA
jgi:hypothetical protein